MPWENAHLPDGSTVQLFRQELTSECGPSCVAMVCRLLGSSNAEPNFTRNALKKIEAGLYEAGDSVDPDFERDGAYMTSLTEVLSAQYHATVHTRYLPDPGPGVLRDNMQRFLSDRTKTRPAILKVAWNGGGLHFVVCLGPMGNPARLQVLDPFHGHVQVDPALLPDYHAGGDAGEIDREVVDVMGRRYRR